MGVLLGCLRWRPRKGKGVVVSPTSDGQPGVRRELGRANLAPRRRTQARGSAEIDKRPWIGRFWPIYPVPSLRNIAGGSALVTEGWGEIQANVLKAY